MRLQSLVVGSEEIELSLGMDDGGREYVFVRLPLDENDLSELSMNQVRISVLRRVQGAIGAEIERLDRRVPLRV